MFDSDAPPPPDHRDKRIAARVDPKTYEMAAARARKKKRSLSAIIRAFLTVWGAGEYPDPPELDDENLRAPMRKAPPPPEPPPPPAKKRPAKPRKK